MVRAPGSAVNPRIQAAHAALRRGEMILVYDADGREEETDMVIASEYATPQLIRTMRRDAGGLLCTAIGPAAHEQLGLPFMADLLAEAAANHPVLRATTPHDIRYDPSKSSFGLTINHRDTYTGITDDDRALTISRLATFLVEHEATPAHEAREAFGAEFRAPGHAILLNGSPGGLAARQGHTELSLELARQAGLAPCTSVCEMLGPDGQALPRAAAEAYAERHGLVFLTGAEVIEASQAAPQPAVPEASPAVAGRRPSTSPGNGRQRARQAATPARA